MDNIHQIDTPSIQWPRHRPRKQMNPKRIVRVPYGIPEAMQLSEEEAKK
jgi:hypothetical protein